MFNNLMVLICSKHDPCTHYPAPTTLRLQLQLPFSPTTDSSNTNRASLRLNTTTHTYTRTPWQTHYPSRSHTVASARCPQK